MFILSHDYFNVEFLSDVCCVCVRSIVGSDMAVFFTA